VNLEAIRKKLKSPVKFNDDDHSYHLKGKKLINVGSVVKRFKEPFDSEYWAARKAKERGVKPEVVLAEWKAKGDIACAKGHRFHSHAQFRMIGKGTPSATPEAKAFDAWWDTAKVNLEVVACEVVLHSEAHGVSGTADLVAYSHKTKTLHVFDWKTNGKFETESAYGKWLLNPFGHLPECALSEYSIQVGLYRMMASWLTGERFGDSFIMHVGEPQPVSPTASGIRITPYRAHSLTDQLTEVFEKL
jgi:hypothetical protein